ncbi:phage tail protein [Megasphaera sp.]|uniref:phage tail-collar fiber domain-containing protein n=1 Tax=Megasphaera sp. TaxID=2023260 RepID=UPI003522FCEC
MSSWIGRVVTNAGKKLDAKVKAGKCKFNFTKFKIGSGTVPAGTSLSSLTDLIHTEKEIGISEIEYNDDEGTCIVHGTLLYSDVENEFLARELGLYAEDPDDGEILYQVTTDDVPDTIKPQSQTTATVVSQEFAMIVTESSSSTTSVTIDPNELVTTKQLARHNTAEDAHENLVMVTETADKPTSMSTRGIWAEVVSGAKAILHRWNKTSKDYDTLHPETEVDQITDFGPGIINQLASSALKDTITEISSDSLLSKMVGLVLQASGVKYLTGQNGYLFFGNFMGNIGIQWGYTTYNSNPNGQTIVPAISFNTFFAGFVTDTGIRWNTGGTFVGLTYESNSLIFWPQYTGSPQTVSKNGTNYHWLIFCM